MVQWKIGQTPILLVSYHFFASGNVPLNHDCGKKSDFFRNGKKIGCPLKKNTYNIYIYSTIYHHLHLPLGYELMGLAVNTKIPSKLLSLSLEAFEVKQTLFGLLDVVWFSVEWWREIQRFRSSSRKGKSTNVSGHVKNIRFVGLLVRNFWAKQASKSWETKNMSRKADTSNPIASMYGLFPYIWLIFMVNVQ